MSAVSERAEEWRHTDGDGDKLIVVGGEFGAVIRAFDHEGDQTSVAVRVEDLPALIETLRAVHTRVTNEDAR